MVTKTFFRKIEGIRRQLEKELESLAAQENDPILLSEHSLLKVDSCIRQVKQLLKVVTFESIAEEVEFFKNHKPFFISRFIYFSRLLDIESNKPSAGEKYVRKYYENELLKLQTFLSEEHDFYNYYRRNATYLDHKYFTRGSYDLKMKLSSNLYNFDEDFTTTHDHKIAVFIATDLLEIYLAQCIKVHSLGLDKKEPGYPKLTWTASKVSLVELIYALNLSHCFNGGNVDFSEIVRHTEKTLNINLGNVYKTIGEIKLRKYKKKRFLEFLSDNLDKILNEEDSIWRTKWANRMNMSTGSFIFLILNLISKHIA